MSVKTIAASLRSGESSGISEEESDQANAMLAAGTLPREPWVWGQSAGHNKPDYQNVMADTA